MTLTFREAARKILTDAGEPLHAHEIARRALAVGLVETTGQTPQATMEATLCVAVRGRDTEFVRVAPRTFGLRSAGATPRASEDTDGDTSPGERRVRVPYFPTYAELKAFLGAASGLLARDVHHLRGAFAEIRGTPQNTADWSEPDVWIAKRLNGRDAETATALWSRSDHIVNPRHTTGVWFTSHHYGLLTTSADGRLGLTERGREILEKPPGPVLRDIDDAEGVLAILQLVAENGPATSGELTEPWGRYLQHHSRVRSDSTSRSHLYHRLRNLIDRGLVARSGTLHTITSEGIAWLGAVDDADATETDPEAELLALARRKQEQVKEALQEILAGMDPYAFEHLIKDLLVAMGYDEVEVTARSNDKGIDVIGRIKVGITDVKEVIQAKRHRKPVQRKDLDALRGCLHRFHAVRGTLMTTSRFSSGTEKAAFEVGAAPITLIDGEKLIDLLIKHEIGVKKRKIEVLALDESAFAGDDEP